MDSSRSSVCVDYSVTQKVLYSNSRIPVNRCCWVAISVVPYLSPVYQPTPRHISTMHTHTCSRAAFGFSLFLFPCLNAIFRWVWESFVFGCIEQKKSEERKLWTKRTVTFAYYATTSTVRCKCTDKLAYTEFDCREFFSKLFCLLISFRVVFCYSWPFFFILFLIVVSTQRFQIREICR